MRMLTVYPRWLPRLGTGQEKPVSRDQTNNVVTPAPSVPATKKIIHKRIL